MKKTTLLSFFVMAMGMWIGGCSDDGASSAKMVTFRGTQSPGDVWEWEVNYNSKKVNAYWDAGTFDDKSDDISIEGDFEILPSGFMKITITGSDPVSAEIPTDGTAYFYALEYPGTALIVKPEGSIKGDIIAMVAQGDCSDVNGTYNYIMSAPGDAIHFSSLENEAYGTVTLEGASSAISISGQKHSLDCLDNGNCTTSGSINGIPTGVCNGKGGLVIEDQDGTLAQGQFTKGGAMMLDMGMGNGGVFALKSSSISVDELDNKSFNGIGYFPASQNNKSVPMLIEFNAEGVGSAFGYTDVDANEVDSNEGAVIHIENINNGLATGTMDFNNGHSPFAASLLKNNGKLIMVLISTTDEEGRPPFILIMTSM